MLEELKTKVCDANLELVRKGVVIYTWGNISGIDRDKGKSSNMSTIDRKSPAFLQGFRI